MRRIAIINQKGGVGKTTSTANLGVALARRGQRVLVADLDPQAHLSLHLGVNGDEAERTMYDVLVRNRPIPEVRQAVGNGLWVLPAHRDLFHAESELVSVIGRETILSDALACDDQAYDYVLFDCPPSLGILSLNGLCAANQVIIPMQAHFLALQGVGKLLETIQLVQARINPDLSVGGVLLCMYDSTTRLGSEVLEDLKAFFDEHRDQDTPWSSAQVFQTVIRRNIKLAESPSHGLSVLDYAPKSHGAIDYIRLAGEILGEAKAVVPAVKTRTEPVPPDVPESPQAQPEAPVVESIQTPTVNPPATPPSVSVSPEAPSVPAQPAETPPPVAVPEVSQPAVPAPRPEVDRDLTTPDRTLPEPGVAQPQSTEPPSIRLPDAAPPPTQPKEKDGPEFPRLASSA
jgi:chromosome partitioning protein